MENLDIRILIGEANIKHKDVAKQIGISPVWFSTQMRHELSPAMRERVIRAIEELKNDQNRS